ncbi:unnamed protein product [Fraxinus pennsylvanica]|uniref:Uncharacterized protein n=1 Tax=Fraxinus pennsylvanica TaxID=56036 RepID=A0AAD2E8F1_9LAMI|nr:unnamed protein product [Fraxinus pennsylvanica]
MGRRRASFLLVVVVCCVVGVGGNEDEWRRKEEEGSEGSGEEGGAVRPKGVDWLLLQDTKQVVKIDAGNMRVFFFICGGTYPMSIFSGFDPLMLSTAFNVSFCSQIKEIVDEQEAGPIISLSNSHSPNI